MKNLFVNKLKSPTVFFAVTGLLLLGCFQTAAFAGLADGGNWKKMQEDKVPVVIYAKQLEHRRAENLLIGEGYVDIRYGKMRLQGDRVEFNTETSQVVAVGNVILDDGASRITGERMEMNLNTKLGSIYDGAGFLETGYYFDGKKIERTAQDEFIIYDGGYTTCDQPLPDWRLRAKKCRLHIENYAYLSHLSMRVKGWPVLYLPYGIFPIKSKRSSGFLIPSAGYSSQDGFMLKESYFWAINDWSDVTLGLDYYGKRGVGKRLEGRYVLNGGDKAQANYYQIEDRITSKDRWKFKLDMTQNLPAQVRGIANLDMLSDPRFDRQFADNLDVRNRQEQESYVSFTRNWDGYNLILWGNYSENLYQEQSKTRFQEQKTVQRRIPELKFNSTSQRLVDTPVFLEWESSWSVLEREVDKEVSTAGGTQLDKEMQVRTQRLNFHPRVSAPLKLRDGVIFTPSVGWWDTWYSDTPGGAASTRNLYDIKMTLDGPQVYRVFEVGGWGELTRLKHIVYPNITYNYIPYADQSYHYSYDGIDRAGPTYRLDYSIINHLLGKFEGQDGSSEIRDVLTLTLSQSYDLAEERRLVNLDTKRHRPFSEVKFDVEFKPVNGIRFDTEAYYNVYDTYIDRINSDVWFNPSGNFNFTAGWRYAKYTGARTSRTDFLNVGAGLSWRAWRLDASTHYDLWTNDRIENRYSVKYSSQCWGITLYHVTRPMEDEFNFMIDLRGLGTLGQAS